MASAFNGLYQENVSTLDWHIDMEIVIDIHVT